MGVHVVVVVTGQHCINDGGIHVIRSWQSISVGGDCTILPVTLRPIGLLITVAHTGVPLSTNKCAVPKVKAPMLLSNVPIGTYCMYIEDPG
jgi:hypothetical protein